MSELDVWVTQYDDIGCDAPAKHIYRCVHPGGFNPDTTFVGAQIAIDGIIYEVCGVDTCELPDGLWRLVYAHYAPEETGESDWYELYGNTDLAV